MGEPKMNVCLFYHLKGKNGLIDFLYSEFSCHLVYIGKEMRWGDSSPGVFPVDAHFMSRNTSHLCSRISLPECIVSRRGRHRWCLLPKRRPECLQPLKEIQLPNSC